MALGKSSVKPVEDKETIVIFGTRRIADLWCREHEVNPKDVILASWGPDFLKGVKGPVKVVRVSKERWTPSTFPDEKRVKGMEDEIKIINRLRKLHDSVDTKETK